MKHKHYDLIVQWAEGAKIEQAFYGGAWYEGTAYANVTWKPMETPTWDPKFTYRVVPPPPPKVYPKSTLTYSDLCRLVNEASKIKTNEGYQTVLARMTADEAVKCFIESGELDKYILEISHEEEE